MSTIRDILQVTVDDLFGLVGEAGTYTPDGGDPVAVTVIPKRPDEIVGLGEAQVLTETAVFDLRASEVSAPAAGDTLTYDGETYTVQSVAWRDPRRLVWTLKTRPA